MVMTFMIVMIIMTAFFEVECGIYSAGSRGRPCILKLASFSEFGNVGSLDLVLPS